MAKIPGPPPNPIKRRRNADALAPTAQGVRRGITVEDPQPSPEWTVPVRNYFRSMLNSGHSPWLENSDLTTLTIQCILLDRIIRQSRTIVMYERDSEGNDVVDEDGNKVPMVDEYGEEQRITIGSVNGQALKTVIDMGADLLATEGARRKLRIDLANPSDDEEPAHKAIIAKQREDLQQVLQKKKSST